LLEVFKNLAIRGSSEKLDAFIAGVSDHLSSGWSRDRDAETRLARAPSPGRYYVFRCEARADRPALSLFLLGKNSALEVSNIVPRGVGSLTRVQYNAALDEFVEQSARSIAERLGLEVSVSSDRQPITHWVSEEAARRLRVFSLAANKGTGSSHPLDFQRWASFLIQVHQDNTRLDSHTLQRWLIEEEGWPAETAIELAVEFGFAQDLLKAYDAGR